MYTIFILFLQDSMNTPLTIGTGVGVISFIALLLIHRFPSLAIFFPVMIFFIGGLMLAYWYIDIRHGWKYPVFPHIIVTVLSLFALLSILELPELRYMLMIIMAAILGICYGWGMNQEDATWKSEKPFRRFVAIIVALDAYAVMSFFFALASFDPSPRLPLIFTILGGALFAGMSLLMWRLYFFVKIKAFIFWMVIMGIMSVEIIWVVHFLPFGPTVLALLTTWLWYVAQLLVRFHFSSRGIVWERQKFFLIANSILFVLLLWLFVRWV